MKNITIRITAIILSSVIVFASLDYRLSGTVQAQEADNITEENNANNAVLDDNLTDDKLVDEQLVFDVTTESNADGRDAGTQSYANSGICGEDGDNVTWTLTDDGVLTISGSGRMKDFALTYTPGDAPWRNSNITKVIINSGVSYISKASFAGTGLVSVEIPNTVTSIGEYAFYRCNELSSVEIPDSITRIGEFCFSDCSKLNQVIMTSGLTSIERGAFKNCVALSSVVFPESLNMIGSEAFSGCTRLSSIVIPDKVTSIGREAFCNCTELGNIVLPEGIRYINEYTFAGCENLKNIVIPGSVSGIEEGAFKDCVNLESAQRSWINLDKSFSVGNNAFAGCVKLESMPYDTGTIGEKAFSGCISLVNVFLSYTKTVGKNAFENCKGIECVYCGASTINEEAFVNCSEIKKIYFETSTRSIKANAFRYCNGITDIYYYGSENQWNSIEIGNYNEPLQNANMHYDYDDYDYELPEPEFVNTKERGYYKRGMEVKLTMEKGYQGATIYYTLDGTEPTRSSIQYRDPIVLSETVTIKAFAVMEGYEDSYIAEETFNVLEEQGTLDGLNWQFDPDTGRLIISGDGAIKDYDGAYGNHPSWDMFGDYATSLEICYGITGIGSNAFGWFRKLQNVSIADSVLSIGEDAFGACNHLKTVVIPDSVTNIEKFAFDGCNRLESAVISGKDLTIETYAFRDCYSLTDLNILPGVTTINEYAFEGCYLLTTVHIPTSVRTIKRDAFRYCNRIRDVYYSGSKELWDRIDINLDIWISGETFYDGGNRNLTSAIIHYGDNANPTISVIGVILNKKTLKLKVGESDVLTAMVQPTSATDKRVTWGLSDQGIVTVDNGIVKAIKAGTSKIIVTTLDGNKTDECMVTVINDISGGENVIPTPGPGTETPVTPPAGHTHTPDVQWHTDEDWHWHECTQCKARCDRGRHSFMYYSGRCLMCGFMCDEMRMLPQTREPDNSPCYYRVMFYSNGGTGGTLMTPINFERDISQALPRNTYKRRGYTFKAWCKNKKGSGKKYIDGEIVNNITKKQGKTISLYAIWTPHRYTIEYDGNGNTSGKMTPSKKLKYGTKYTLKTNKFKRKGYKFVGWNTEADGTGEAFKNKKKVKELISKDGGTITLYAQWQQK